MPRKENMFEGEGNLGRLINKKLAQRVVDLTIGTSVLVGGGLGIADIGRAAEQECMRREC